MADDNKPELITPPNTLKNKVGTGGPGAVDLDALERAEAVIASLTDNYLEWVQDDLKKLDDAYRILKTERDNDKENIDRVFQIAHDIKGQGGSFGYDLMTVIGNSLCRFTEDKETMNDAEINVVQLHIDTMKLVIANNMKDDGGTEGAKLLKGIELVVAKVKG